MEDPMFNEEAIKAIRRLSEAVRILSEEEDEGEIQVASESSSSEERPPIVIGDCSAPTSSKEEEKDSSSSFSFSEEEEEKEEEKITKKIKKHSPPNKPSKWPIYEGGHYIWYIDDVPPNSTPPKIRPISLYDQLDKYAAQILKDCEEKGQTITAKVLKKFGHHSRWFVHFPQSPSIEDQWITYNQLRYIHYRIGVLNQIHKQEK